MAYYHSPDSWEYTLDKKHGFGILFDVEDHRAFNQCFYADGTLTQAGGAVDFNRSMEELKRHMPGARWGVSVSKTAQAEYERVMRSATCTFTPGEGEAIYAELQGNGNTIRVSVIKDNDRWGGYTAKCNCGKISCGHIRAAADFMFQALRQLDHAYVSTDQPVRKSILLEQELKERTLDIKNEDPDIQLIGELKEILRLVRSAKSGDYYRRYHEYLMELEPAYDYDSKFMEEYFEELLVALFEDKGYQDAVMASGKFAEPSDYEGRQRRSNRTCLKRILKEYQRACKAMDEKGDYEEHYYKELLLKYRENWPGLLRYYAEGKELIEDYDLPFLMIIAGAPEIDVAYIGPVAKKLDTMNDTKKAAPALRALAERLSSDQKVEVYSQLRKLSMSAEEIRGLGKADQLKMIRNTPLTKESFQYIMAELLADSAPAEQGRFLLHAVDKAWNTKDAELKAAIAEAAGKLPDNKLLLYHVLYRMKDSKAYFQRNGEQAFMKGFAPAKGDPERELKTYFNCQYEIIRKDKEIYALFNIVDPEWDMSVLQAIEENGRLRIFRSDGYDKLGYSPELIRKVCLEGKEEKYNEAFEDSQDALAADLFEQENRHFVKEYKQLCESLSEEKILYTEAGKVGVEWLIYRQEGSNALAFKIGNSRKYVVKDAIEFLKAFRTGATAEYGKDLILTHDTDNLEETDGALIKQLTTAKYAKGRRGEPNNKRYITFSNALLGTVLETLTGRTVFFNDTPCQLRMEPRKIGIKISKSYVLSTEIKANQQYMNLAGKGYLLTTGKGQEINTIDRVEGSVEEMNLISLVQEHPKTSIKPILKDFRKNIYSRFFEMFEVDKAVEKDFTLSQIRLNTYFDFEKGTISARTVVLRDEKEIAPEKLDRIDRVKVELLENYLATLGFVEGVLAEESRVLAFFKMDFTRLKTLTNVYLSESLKNKELKSVGRPVIRVTYQNNLVRVFLEKSDFTESELEQIIAGLRKKRKYILLDGERIVDLDSDAARDFGETVQDFQMDPKDLYRKKTISMVNAIKAFSHERSCRVDKYLRDMIEEIRSFKEAEIAPPALKSPLRDYQAEGFRWLSILTKYNMGGILADDMGLGKTIQVIALLKSDRSRKPSLVVCPKSLIFNWLSEFARFDGTMKVAAIYGPDSRRSEIIAGIDGKERAVYITSYDSLRNDITKYTGEFNYVILDEAQYIKNVNAQKTKSVKELKASHRFALTGTPIENSVIDLWSIFDFIMPGYFEELSKFQDTEHAAIARKAGPFILRRVKEDVLEDLPAKYERILSTDMSDGQRKLYDAMRQEARKALEEGGKAFDLLPYLTRLRQVCVDPGMFAEGYQGGSGKMEMLKTLIPEYLENHHRILIFSQFVKALEGVREMLNRQGIPTYFLSGATPAKDRVEMMDSFNNGSGTDVFLISLKAGGTGLNLTGADTVIHLDPWWNVAAENQASDRTHRIGQTRNVEVIKLIAGESIEQRVVELQDMKKEVIKQVISDDDGSVTSASLEDIAFVLD
ncbi:MAG: SNF2 helicase associated domain-containing protein [Clostridia bacterium]|nr:SNF2 helicase associated domain-containing protein [Clostridia bacterium]